MPCLKQAVGFAFRLAVDDIETVGDSVCSFHNQLLSFGLGNLPFAPHHAYSLGAHGAAVKRPVCDVHHINPAIHSAISAATEPGVSCARSTVIGMNLDSPPATNAFVRNVRYASVTLRGL